MHGEKHCTPDPRVTLGAIQGSPREARFHRRNPQRLAGTLALPKTLRAWCVRIVERVILVVIYRRAWHKQVSQTQRKMEEAEQP